MNKRVFLALVVLMSLSLIGIILVQAYYINNSLRNTEEQFNFNVKKGETVLIPAVLDFITLYPSVKSRIIETYIEYTARIERCDDCLIHIVE